EKSAGIRTDRFRAQDQSHSNLPSSSRYRTSASRVGPDSRTPIGLHYDGSVVQESTQSDEDDFEVQELEIQLQIAKLKRQQKALKAKRAQRSRQQDTSGGESV